MATAKPSRMVFSLRPRRLTQSANRSHTLPARTAARRAARLAGRVGSGNCGSFGTGGSYLPRVVEGTGPLVQVGRDPIGEGAPGAIEAALHSSEIAAGELGDLLVAPALELAHHEDLPVMGREGRDRGVHQLAHVA